MKKLYTISAFLILTVLAVSSVAANEKPLIAVFDFNTNQVPEADMRTIIDLVSTALFESGSYAVIDSGRRDALLAEQNFSLSGNSDEQNQLKAGKLLSAEYIVTGSISFLEERYLVTVRIVDTETSLTTHSTKMTVDSISELIDSVDMMVGKMLAGNGSGEPSADAMTDGPGDELTDDLTVEEAPVEGDDGAACPRPAAVL